MTQNRVKLDSDDKVKLLEMFGGCVSIQEFSAISNTTREVIDNKVETSELFCFVDDKNKKVLPIWQCHEGVLLNGLAAVYNSLVRQDIWGKVIFMTSPSDYLEDMLSELMEIKKVTPIDALRKKYISEVITASKFAL